MNKNPIRIFEGTAKPYEPFWRVVNAAQSESGEPEIEFYGVISEYSLFEDDITPAKFKADLYGAGLGGPVTVRINSPGGDVIAASVLRSVLMEYPGRVTCRIDGVCASAATLVAIAGDRVLMQDSAMFMIHDPAIMVMGTVETLKTAIEALKATKEAIILAYESHSDLNAEQIARMMTAETWMNASEAQEYGFVDEIIRVNANKESLRGLRNAALLNVLSNYVNVPPELLSSMQPAATDEPTVVVEEPTVGPDPDQVERLRAYLDIFA